MSRRIRITALLTLLALYHGELAPVAAVAAREKQTQMAQGLGDVADQMRFGVTGLTVEVDPADEEEDDGFPGGGLWSYDSLLGSATSMHPEELSATEANTFLPQEIPTAVQESSPNALRFLQQL